jgi:dolichyl-phosphate beta-glucosyltransferase
MKELSMIIPAYNEAARIGPTLLSFYNFLATKEISFEIIVVDDGSTDQTVELVKGLKTEIPELLIIAMPHNKGKGCAVRTGMLKAQGQIRLFSDADGSTPIEEMDKLLPPILAGEADITIGSRYLDGAEIDKAQPAFRIVWSRFANRVVQQILLPGIVDPHCGFKAFSAAAAEKIFSLCTVNEWSFDLEVLALARSLNLRIAEFPVKWTNDERSKGRISQLPKEILNLYRIKKRQHYTSELSQRQKLSGI